MKNIFTFVLPLFTTISIGQVQMFEPNKISDNQSFGIAVSPGGNNLLFMKAFGGRDSLQIHQSKKLDGIWQEPELAFFSTRGINEIDPSFSPDGNTILYNALLSEKDGYDVFKLEKTISGWSKPEKLSNAINTGASEFYATMATNKNVYFTRRLESNDIYVSHWIDAQYQKAISIGPTINSTESESNPYISPNEDFIIFISTREGGFGNADLYISFQKQNKWSHPINLGNVVNTDVSEFCPSIDKKNERFFFSRTVVEDKKRVENIYSISLEELGIDKLQKVAKWAK